MRRPGFTLFEVLLALAVLSGSMYVLTDLNVKALLRMFKDRDELEKLFYLKKEIAGLMGPLERKIKPGRQVIEEPPLNLEVMLPELSQKSAVQKIVGDCCVVLRVQAAWSYFGAQRALALYALYFDPGKLEQKKEKS